MALTREAFKIRYPEFNAVADARIDIYLNDSTPYWDNPPLSFNLGTSKELAQALIVAHWCSIFPQVDNNGDPLLISDPNQVSESSIKVDEITVTDKNAAATSSNSAYLAESNSSTYGKEYVKLLKMYDPKYNASGSKSSETYVGALPVTLDW